jgi:putative phosphoserine phosphatase / 1-acylglycerol-3-phosphate O-acyltransferase
MARATDEAIRAAFFRVEGPLVRAPSLRSAAWFTMNAQDVAGRVTRLGGVALATGLRFAGSLGEAQLVQRAAWMGLRGMSEDRVAFLGEEYFERFIEPNVLELGRELVDEARRQGHRIVLLSESIGPVVDRLQALFRADDLICNNLEMRGGRATGRLTEPVIGGALSGNWARHWASEHAVDLTASSAYGTTGTDSMLMNVIGRPCAVNPDRRLRRIARDLDWPVVDR